MIRHLKNHHKKYLFGLIWGGLFVKLAIFVITGMGISLTLGTHAEAQTGCYMTGEYLTGGYFTGSELIPGYYTGGYFTGAYETGCYMTGEYLTGGYYEGEIRTGEYFTGAYETGCYMTGEYFTGEYYVEEYLSGEYLTGQYLTGGYEYCPIQAQTALCEPADVNILSPQSGNIVGGEVLVQREYLNADCATDLKEFTVQLYDHNDQRIDIGTGASTEDSINFDSTLLLSGMYTITGINTSGEIYTIYTGEYQGNTIDYATGYQIRLVDSLLTPYFLEENITIDNKKPSITGIVVSLQGVKNSSMSVGGSATISFLADEELSGTVVRIRGQDMQLHTSSGLNYIYKHTLTTNNQEGNLNFSIAYKDLAGNTGRYSSTGPIVFDKTAPVIENMSVTGNAQDGFVLSRRTTEDVAYKLTYSIDEGTEKEVIHTGYDDSFEYRIIDLGVGQTFECELRVEDRVGNSTTIKGKIIINAQGNIDFEYSFMGSATAQVPDGTQEIIEGEVEPVSTLAVTIKKEIEKFNNCRNSVDYKELELKVKGKDLVLNMPTFGKDSVRTITRAFIIFMVEKLGKNASMTQEDLDLVTRKFNNFLVILKLVRDDENDCRQSLSNYHILQFQKTMKEFNIEI